MKAKLEFNLPEEKEEFELACSGSAWSNIAWLMDQFLRSKVKYGEIESFTTCDAYQAARDYLWESMDDNGVNFN